VLLVAAADEDVLDGSGRTDERRVHGGLEREDLALAPAAVGRDHHAGRRVVDACAEALRAEAAEDDGVHGADARDGEHRDDGLGDHRQVDRDPVARDHAEVLQGVRGALDLGGELGVGEVAGVARFALPVQGHAVAVAREHVPVQAVVGDVEPAVGEPAGDGRVRPVEHGRERRLPGHELAGPVGPEAEAVGGGVGGQGLVGHAGGAERLRRRVDGSRLVRLGWTGGGRRPLLVLVARGGPRVSGVGRFGVMGHRHPLRDPR
jgi:hypothetical protein